MKTKVHLPHSPTALLSSQEREKVFLEVHIQNLTQDAMWLERMQFECVDGWQVQDANSLENPVSGSKEPLFSGSTALMQPQDVRQYIYILLPVSLPPFPITHAPGAILGLGRLDISWRSSYGEPGRLLTSVRGKHSSVKETWVFTWHTYRHCRVESPLSKPHQIPKLLPLE